MIVFVEGGLNIPLKKMAETRPTVTKRADHVTWAALRKFVYDVLAKAGYKRTDMLAQSGLMKAEFEVKDFYKLVPEDIMYFAGGTLRAGFVESYFLKSYREQTLKETSNLPAIAQVAGIVANPKVTSVVRQDTIFNTIQAMGLPVKINAMKNVVAEVPDMPTAGTVLQKIYQMFGVKGSFMVTWEGKGKLYFDPKTPVDKPIALAYAKQAKLPPPNFQKLLNSTVKTESVNTGRYHFIVNTEELTPKQWMDFNKDVQKIRDADPGVFIDSIPGGNDNAYNFCDCYKEWQALLKKYFPKVKIKSGFYKGRTGAY